MAPKRPTAGEQREAAKAARYQQALDKAADEFVCPITQELPIDPVLAEDGRVYDRKAIEDWLNTRQPGQPLKSPVTNMAMGSRLVPTIQVRNTIKSLVQSGALTGDKVEAWKVRIKDEEEVEATRRLADAGDAAANSTLSIWYRDGEKGLDKDFKMCFQYSKKAAELDSPCGLTTLGICYLDGHGCRANLPRAMLHLGEAAARGSEHAAYIIGWLYIEGLHGIGKDEEEAAIYFRKMAKSTLRNSPQESRDKADAFLRGRSPAVELA